MKIILFVSLFLYTKSGISQPIPRQRIQDSVIGWMKIYNFKGIKESKKVDHRLYSPAQLSLCDSFANWMQASYTPKGALGDIKKTVTEKLGPYNQHTAGKPQGYGAYSKSYIELRYNSNRKIEPVTNSNVLWYVFANDVPGDWGIRDICSPTQYYFTMPDAGTDIEDDKIKKQLDLTKNENIKPYISFWIKNMGFGGGMQTVLLCKDNKSPFIKITKGEYLQALEDAIPRYYEVQKKKISEAEQGIQSRIAVAVKSLDAKIDQFLTGLKQNKEKYRNRLEEPAMTSAQPSLSDLANARDVFTSQYLTDPESTSTRYPVYKIDPVMAALCKKDKPQWILISWEYYPGNPMEQQQHEAIINHFNFQYVYNFFFSPEKVKGKPYKPL